MISISWSCKTGIFLDLSPFLHELLHFSMLAIFVEVFFCVFVLILMYLTLSSKLVILPEVLDLHALQAVINLEEVLGQRPVGLY